MGAMVIFRNMEQMGLKRPKVSPKEDPRAWWKYAYDAVRCKIGENKSKWDFEEMLKRRGDRLKYISLWKTRRRKLLQQQATTTTTTTIRPNAPLPEFLISLSTTGSLMATTDEMELESLAVELMLLERRLPYQDILAYRRMADTEMKQEIPQPVPLASSTSVGSGGIGGTTSFSWKRLLSQEEGLAMDADMEPEAQYSHMVFKVDIELQKAEMALASVQTSGGGGAVVVMDTTQGSIPFLRIMMESLHIAADGDFSVGLKQARVSLEDLQVLSRSAPVIDDDNDDVILDARTHWSRLVSRRLVVGAPVVPSLTATRGMGSQHSTSLSSTASTLFGGGGGGPSPLFALQLDKFPQGSDYNTSLKIEVQELQLVFVPSAPWLNSVSSFLDVPEFVDSWAELEAIALNSLDTFRQQIDAKMEFILRNHVKTLMDIRVKGPLLIISEASQPSAHLLTPTQHLGLCLELRDLTLLTLEGGNDQDIPCNTSNTTTTASSTAAPPTLGGLQTTHNHGSIDGSTLGNSFIYPDSDMVQQVKDHLYDHFVLHLSEVHMYLSQDNPGATPIPGALPSQLPLFDPLDIQVFIASSRIKTDTSYPRLKITTNTTELAVRISDSTLKYLVRLIASSLESTDKAGQDLDAIRKKFERLAPSGACSRKLNSFLAGIDALSPQRGISGRSVDTQAFFPANDGEGTIHALPSVDDNRSYVSLDTVNSWIGRKSKMEIMESMEVHDDDHDGYDSAQEFSDEDLLDAAEESGAEEGVGGGQSSSRRPSLHLSDIVEEVMDEQQPLNQATLMALADQNKQPPHSVVATCPQLTLRLCVPRFSVYLSLYHGPRGMKEQKGVAHLAITGLSLQYHQHTQRHRLRLTVDEVVMEGASMWRDSRDVIDLPSDFILLRVAAQLQDTLNDDMTTPLMSSANNRKRGVSIDSTDGAQWHPIHKTQAITLQVSVGIDPDSKATGRPFKDLRGQTRVKQVGIHLDQGLLVAIIKVRKMPSTIFLVRGKSLRHINYHMKFCWRCIT